MCIQAQIGEGNGNPLQYSCLENPTDRGAWRATIHGGARSRTPTNTQTQIQIESPPCLFFKYKFIYVNWTLITLQYCSGFAIH